MCTGSEQQYEFLYVGIDCAISFHKIEIPSVKSEV